MWTMTMTSKNSTVESTLATVANLQGRIRRADQEEIRAATGSNPNRVLMEAWLASHRCWSILRGEKTVAVFGVTCVSAAEEIGSPWLLGSEDIEESVFYFLRICKPYIAHMLSLFPVLYNYADARNTLSIKWLRWCKFKIEEPKPYGAFGLPFHRFEMRRTDHV